MTILLVLSTLVTFLIIDWCRTAAEEQRRAFAFQKVRGTYITSPGFECLGALAQDGGIRVEQVDWEI